MLEQNEGRKQSKLGNIVENIATRISGNLCVNDF